MYLLWENKENDSSSTPHEEILEFYHTYPIAFNTTSFAEKHLFKLEDFDPQVLYHETATYIIGRFGNPVGLIVASK